MLGCLYPWLLFHIQGLSLASCTPVKTLAYDTILANARFFNNDIDAVPRMALTVGVGTVLDSREVLVVVMGLKKSLVLSKAIENGVNYLVHWNLFHLCIFAYQSFMDTLRPPVAPMGSDSC